MFLIQQVTADALQQQVLVLPDGTNFQMTLYFRPIQQGWFINQLAFGDRFELNGLRVTNSPNMLNQFRNLIPFGLGCFSANNREPSQSQDFSSGASKLYALSAAEVRQYAEFLALG